MKLHANARTCPHSRRLTVDRVEREGWTLAAAAEAAGVSVRTVSKWRRRYREEGEQGLLDRYSAPACVPLRTGEARVAVIAGLRRLRMTAAEIAETLGMPLSTVSGILTRIGLGKLWRLEPLEPSNRYEKTRPGELVHVDVKKLGRIGRPGHRVNGDRRTRSAGSAGSTCMSQSTTPPAVPMSRCSKTRGPRQRSTSCAAPSRTSPLSGSASSD